MDEVIFNLPQHLRCQVAETAAIIVSRVARRILSKQLMQTIHLVHPIMEKSGQK
jgi:hypothetical protein